MPTPRKNVNKHGGNRTGMGAQRFTSPADKSTIRALTSGIRSDAPKVTCSVCKEQVPVRAKDGQIVAHRVGTNRKNSWPCPGGVPAHGGYQKENEVSRTPILIDKDHGVPVKFKGKSRELLERAIAGGWTGRMSARGHAIMKHPSGETMSIGSNLSLANRSSQNAESAIKRVEKAEAAKAPTPVPTRPPLAPVPVYTAPEPRLDHTPQEMEMETAPAKDFLAPSFADIKPGLVGPHVVGQRPYMSSQGTHKYPSDWVNEVQWSDGTVTLRCRYCDYTNDHTSSIGVHAAIKHADMKPEVPNKDNKATWVPDPGLAQRSRDTSNARAAVIRKKKLAMKQKIEDHGPLLSEGPWMAHRGGTKNNSGGGYVYPSSTVIERYWTDGTVDYACTGCDYTSAKPRGVSAHYAQHVGHDTRHPRAEIKGYIQDPTYTANVTNRDGSRAKVKKEQPAEAATAVQTYDIDKVLDQIRTLVGVQDQSDEIAALCAHRDQLIADKNALGVELAETRARAEKAEGDLAAFRDLARELSGL